MLLCASFWFGIGATLLMTLKNAGMPFTALTKEMSILLWKCPNWQSSFGAIKGDAIQCIRHNGPGGIVEGGLFN